MKEHQISMIEPEADLLSIQFGGDDDIDANLLASSVENLSQIIELARDEIVPDVPIRIKITAIRSGSFIIDIKSILETMSNAGGTLAFITSIVLGVFKLHRWLKGRSPKKIKKIDSEKIEITNHEGAKNLFDQAVYHLLTNTSCTERVTDIFIGLTNDGTRAYIKLSSPTDSVEIYKHEFPILSEDHYLANCEDDIDVTRIPQVELIIKRPVLSGHSKWSFYLNKQINAFIEDEQFLEKVNKREYVFGNGDSLLVSLRIERPKDDMGQIIIGPERYFVEKVIEVRSRRDIDEDQITIEQYINTIK